MPWHCGHMGDSTLQMWKKCWLGPMCPVWSWNIRDDWRWSRPEISCKYFLEGMELSIVLKRFSLSEFFQHRCHLFFSLSLFPCQSAEILSGSFLRSSWGRNLASLNEPWAASFASSSAHLFGLKLQCPGTQCSCKLTIPLVLPFHWIPSSKARWQALLFIRLSCFTCKLLVERWMVLLWIR